MKYFRLAVLAMLMSLNAGAASLITEAEARLPDASAVRARSITRGPAIRVISPDPATATRSPFNFKLAFEARGGAKIVPDSVRVSYLKTPAVDLLERIRPGISEQGIDLAGAVVPPGEHQIQMSVEDSEGRRTTTVIKLSVVK